MRKFHFCDNPTEHGFGAVGSLDDSGNQSFNAASSSTEHGFGAHGGEDSRAPHDFRVGESLTRSDKVSNSDPWGKVRVLHGSSSKLCRPTSFDLRPQSTGLEGRVVVMIMRIVWICWIYVLRPMTRLTQAGRKFGVSLACGVYVYMS